eukprot:4658313-Prymnesium_polylepis.2
MGHGDGARSFSEESPLWHLASGGHTRQTSPRMPVAPRPGVSGIHSERHSASQSVTNVIHDYVGRVDFPFRSNLTVAQLGIDRDRIRLECVPMSNLAPLPAPRSGSGLRSARCAVGCTIYGARRYAVIVNPFKNKICHKRRLTCNMHASP